MYISPDRVSKLLSDSENLINSDLVNSIPETKVVIRGTKPGVTPGSIISQPEKLERRDNATKAMIGTLANLISRNDLSKTLGIAPSSISKFKIGRDLDSNVNVEVREEIKDSLSDLRKKAIAKALVAMDCILDEKLISETPSALSKIIANLATVHEKLGPKSPVFNLGQQVIFYSPRERSLDDYDTVTV